jgi:molybdate transport system substrate-binding protein
MGKALSEGRYTQRVLSLLRLSIVLMVCAGPVCAQSGDLLVAAAADLSALEKPLTEVFSRRTGAKLRWTFGSSGMLARQIANGAPFDVYLAANESFVRDLAEAGRIEPASVVVYARGRLGLYSQSGHWKNLAALLQARHVAIANPAHAPYGAAARELLVAEGLWTQLEPRIVYGENVRQTLQFAESGNAEAALVAWSLVHRSGGILLPELHTPILQAAGVVARSTNLERARQLVAFLRSEEGLQVLTSGGFFPPEPAPATVQPASPKATALPKAPGEAKSNVPPKSRGKVRRGQSEPRAK